MNCTRRASADKEVTLEAENALLKRPLEVYLYDEIISRDWTFRDTLELPNEDFWLAQPILLDNLTEVPANYLKRGLPIVPVASLGVPVFENEEVLSIYAEAFIGNGKYILQYKLTDSFGNMIQVHLVICAVIKEYTVVQQA